MARATALFLLLLAGGMFFTGCTAEKTPADQGENGGAKSTAPAALTDFKVKFETSKGDFVVLVHPKWAPIGAAHFKMLVENGYYDGNGFYRVLPNFVIQFGLNGDPTITRNFTLRRLKDDPVLTTNARGTVTYATGGPNTRATDLFINMRNNAGLDSRGFSPFGEVIEGMSVVESINPEYAERPDQGRIKDAGDEYLKAEFPRLDYILKATIIP